MSLHDVIKSDAVAVFCNDQDFAEWVTYQKKDGTSRRISVVVDRMSYAGVDANGAQYTLPVYEVHVANNSETGISSLELNRGGDYFEFAGMIGREPERKSIKLLVSHDEGMLVLQCQ